MDELYEIKKILIDFHDKELNSYNTEVVAKLIVEAAYKLKPIEPNANADTKQVQDMRQVIENLSKENEYYRKWINAIQFTANNPGRTNEND